ncbi:MAG: T9SS type A sorting domain-containing protein [Ignavibacteria bacterium]|nr:MAG: T9SS type A sorting domain-containing protein [Ignavibacteria bacterium]
MIPPREHCTAERPKAALIDSTLPEEYTLRQNFPNPFNPSTTISYELPHSSVVRLSIFNTLGQEVLTLVNKFEDAGFKSVRFDGSKFPTGLYFYRMTAGRFVQTKKAMLLK